MLNYLCVAELINVPVFVVESIRVVESMRVVESKRVVKSIRGCGGDYAYYRVCECDRVFTCGRVYMCGRVYTCGSVCTCGRIYTSGRVYACGVNEPDTSCCGEVERASVVVQNILDV